MMSSRQWTAVFLVVCAGGLAAAEGELRKWRDADTNLQIQAVLPKVEGNSVHIRRDDGRVFQLPLTRLSPADRQYVDAFAAKAAVAPAAAPASPLARPAAADSIVLVRQQAGSLHLLLPGIVCATAGNKTYIAVHGHQLENSEFSTLGTATVLWGAAGEHNGIPAKRL